MMKHWLGYGLFLTLLAIPGEAVAETILQQTGVLEPGDFTLEDGSLYDRYEFEGEAGQGVVIQATSDEFDTYLLLRDASGQSLAENDDWNGEQNSIIGYVLPETGTYQVWVNAYSADGQGSYGVAIDAVGANHQVVQEAHADRLNSQGEDLYYRAQYREALELFEQSLAIRREIGDRRGEGVSLNNIGRIYDSLGEYPKALELYEQSLAIRQELGDRRGEGVTLNNIGLIYDSLGEYPKALERYEQSLAILQEIGDRRGEGVTLNNIGLIYDSLGEYLKALERYEQSLAIFQEIGDRRGEGLLLTSIGGIYDSLGEYSKALERYEQSLAIFQEIGDRRGEGTTLNNIGLIYSSLGEYPKALERYEQSLAIRQAIGDRRGEGTTLNNIGGIYSSLSEYPKALELYEQSLAIRQAIGDRSGEGNSLHNIGYVLESLGYPILAIVYLKQSVNTYEAIRTSNRGLAQESQEAFTEQVANSYRKLADLLLQQDRVLEAQRVLDLLKVQELDDYLGGVRSYETTASGIDLLPQEASLWADRAGTLARAIPLATELQQLRQKPFPSRTQAENDRIQALELEQGQILDQFLAFIASEEVQKIIAQLERTVTDPEQDVITQLNRFPTLQDNLEAIGNAVLLYPLILEDRLELVLVTPDGPPTRHPVAIPREQLTAKIAEFQGLLRDKHSNPEPLAQELYQLLVEPLETALTAAEAETIIYAPDGPLRYIPLAALHDGEGWLAQRYEVNHITAASLTDLNLRPARQPVVLAGAFQEGRHEVTVGEKSLAFAGLPYAGIEVDLLQEAFPTTPFYDDGFSRRAVEPLMNDHSIVHLATHAALLVGSPLDSFILFGNGERLTLEDLKGWRGRLRSVDLVVLSACETGTGSIKDASGEEILGFGYLMQDAGARAVLSSLWPVSDGGTQELMTNFYAALQVPGMTKAEALQQAQIALIEGNQVDPGSGERFTRIPDDPEAAERPNGRLAHPYYWAPFILIGNGL